MLQGGNGGFVLQTLPETMNIKIDHQSEKYIREMIRRNRLYESPSDLVNKAIDRFYEQEKKCRFR